ncbi:MAG: DUF393 domain-containing protein [Chitinophagales bacterium]|nr:DUF393 domain-containing protein [Chitinophagaceae bacterium]MCB9064722.1 DUF393 domain-containing protein [Chitinophagales bacterium]
MLPNDNRPILFFDGVCNLCNGVVRFIVRNDKHAAFRFASLQSASGKELESRLKPEMDKLPDSLVLSYKGKIYFRSDAALKTALLLGGRWKLLSAGYIFPKFVRDAVYELIARNRYKWFGRRDECMVPNEELATRFLD